MLGKVDFDVIDETCFPRLSKFSACTLLTLIYFPEHKVPITGLRNGISKLSQFQTFLTIQYVSSKINPSLKIMKMSVRF